MTISTIVLAITGVPRESGRRGGSASAPKEEGGVLKKWLDRLANALNRLAVKTVEPLPATIGTDVDSSLSFLGKAVEFVAEHTWALIFAVAGIIGVWLMQRVKKD